MQMKVLSDAVDAAQGNLIFAGGYWMYVTYPWFRISGFLTAGTLMSIGCDDGDGPTASVKFYNTHDNREYKPDTQLALFEKKHPIVPVDDQGRALYFYRTAGAFRCLSPKGQARRAVTVSLTQQHVIAFTQMRPFRRRCCRQRRLRRRSRRSSSSAQPPP